MYSTQFCKGVAQVSNAPLNGHVDAKHLALFQAVPVDHGHVDWSHLPLGEGQRDTDVGIKGAGPGTTRGADDGRAELALEETLYEAIVILHVTGQRLCRHLFVRTTCSILCEGKEGERKGKKEEERRGNEEVRCVETKTTQVMLYPLMTTPCLIPQDNTSMQLDTL